MMLSKMRTQDRHNEKKFEKRSLKSDRLPKEEREYMRVSSNQSNLGLMPAQIWPFQSGAEVTRRDFLKLSLATSIAISAGPPAWAAEAKGEMPTRTLGGTGEK